MTFPELVIGWDSEYQTDSSGTTPISHQFYAIDREAGNEYQEVFYYSTKPTFAALLTQMLNRLKQRFPLNERQLILVSHFSAAEFGQLADGPEAALRNRLNVHSKGYFGKISEAGYQFNLFDTNVLFQCSLEELGKDLGLPKIDIETQGHKKSEMKYLIDADKSLFERYALRDAEICARILVLYSEFCDRHEFTRSFTLGSVFEKRLAQCLRDAATVKRNEGNRVKALGFEVAKKVTFKKSSLKARRELSASKEAHEFTKVYHGGRNETFLYGLFPKRDVYDYDLQSAYNLAMTCIGEWPFGEERYISDINELYRFLCDYPLALGMVNLEFKFRPETRFPGLPISGDAGLIYPLEGKVWCTAQEFLVSFPYLDPDRSRLLMAVVYKPVAASSLISELAHDLKRKRDASGKGTLENRLLKLVANAGYGKLAQGLGNTTVIDTAHSTADHVQSVALEPSRITNPALAAFVTGCIRALVSEYLLHLGSRGDIVGTVTTDGITILDRELTAEEMAGVGPFSLHMANRCRDIFGTGLLELKHAGNGLLAVKTRGYTMLEELPTKPMKLLTAMTGLQLRENANSGNFPEFLRVEFEGLELAKPSNYTESSATSKSLWLEGKSDFTFVKALKSYNWDYDLKRKPQKFSNKSFLTAPWITIEEHGEVRSRYLAFGKSKIASNKLLWHEEAWEDFWRFCQLRKSGRVERITPTMLKMMPLVKEFCDGSNSLSERRFAESHGLNHRTFSRFLRSLGQQGTLPSVNTTIDPGGSRGDSVSNLQTTGYLIDPDPRRVTCLGHQHQHRPSVSNAIDPLEHPRSTHEIRVNNAVIEDGIFSPGDPLRQEPLRDGLPRMNLAPLHPGSFLGQQEHLPSVNTTDDPAPVWVNSLGISDEVRFLVDPTGGNQYLDSVPGLGQQEHLLSIHTTIDPATSSPSTPTTRVNNAINVERVATTDDSKNVPFDEEQWQRDFDELQEFIHKHAVPQQPTLQQQAELDKIDAFFADI